MRIGVAGQRRHVKAEPLRRVAHPPADAQQRLARQRDKRVSALRIRQADLSRGENRVVGEPRARKVEVRVAVELGAPAADVELAAVRAVAHARQRQIQIGWSEMRLRNT